MITESVVIGGSSFLRQAQATDAVCSDFASSCAFYIHNYLEKFAFLLENSYNKKG
jgi:hypothetical protein